MSLKKTVEDCCFFSMIFELNQLVVVFFSTDFDPAIVSPEIIILLNNHSPLGLTILE